jgi:murein DD-endopeptidase MepM/ murein hydrolase activator NlpD
MGKFKYTLLLIPDAEHPVKHANFSLIPIYFSLLLLLFGCISFTFWLYSVKVGYVQSIQSLEDSLLSSQEETKQVSSQKDELIEDLQKQIILLSHQAEEVKAKIEELQILKGEIQSLSDKVIPEKGQKLFSTLDEEIMQTIEPLAAGGEEKRVTDEHILDVLQETESSYTQSQQEMVHLQEKMEKAKTLLEEIYELQQNTPSIWPTRPGRISSGFGVRQDPFTKKPSFHDGIDIIGDIGDPVYATANGIVKTQADDWLKGMHIILTHTEGYQTHYYHLSKILVKRGQFVKKGEVIGYIGTSGRSTGPHLHYEVHENGKPVNPVPYLQFFREDDE